MECMYAIVDLGNPIWRMITPIMDSNDDTVINEVSGNLKYIHFVLPLLLRFSLQF